MIWTVALLFFNISVEARIQFKPPLTEQWVVTEVRASIEPAHAELQIKDKNRLFIGSLWPAIEVWGVDLDRMAFLEKELKRPPPPQPGSEVKAHSTEHYKFIFDYWHWANLILRLYGAELGSVYVRDRWLPTPKFRESIDEYLNRVVGNFTTERFEFRKCDSEGSNLIHQFGKGRPKDLKLPAPEIFFDYFLFKGKFVKIKKVLTCKLNPAYAPKLEHNSAPKSSIVCPSC